jgi:Ca2+-binding RTX toxin-like protein
MHTTATLRRLAVAAAVSGAAVIATPALASAASTCTYDAGSKSVIVTDHSGAKPLRIFRTAAGQIRISDGVDQATGSFCPIPGTLDVADASNTDRIAVFGLFGDVSATFGDGYIIDEREGFLGPGATPETDGASEIEVVLSTAGIRAPVEVIGTAGNDEIRLGKDGKINLGLNTTPLTDQDIDISPQVDPSLVRLHGSFGHDLLATFGNEISRNPGPSTTRTELYGDDGNDDLIGGGGFDAFRGGFGDDEYFAVDGNTESVAEIGVNTGFDTATFDSQDVVTGEIERRFQSEPVGRLKLTPAATTAPAGKPVQLKLAWTHPKAWKQLRSLELHAVDTGKTVGTITIDPANGRVSDRGGVQLMRGASTVRHHGKTVTAHLALRASSRLAGRTLHFTVAATDAGGHRQIEPLAGGLTVAE